jgi:hypothetical protein
LGTNDEHTVSNAILSHPVGELRQMSSDSADVVLMCYMLSFLPHGRLRWHACKTAVMVLCEGGLLVIMEPKRGVRQRNWAKHWMHILVTSFGLTSVKEEQRMHTVVLLLSKPIGWCCPIGEPMPLDFC